MKQHTSLLLLLFYLPQPALLAAEPGVAGESFAETALQASSEYTELVNNYKNQISELESSVGPYDHSLLESLQGLSNAHRDYGNYEANKDLINRRLQLIRITSGLNSFDQIPLLQEMITNDIRLSSWNDITGHFEFLLWLQNQQANGDPEARLSAKNDIAQWHLNVMYLQDSRRRVRNFLDARNLHDDIVRDAEDLYGEDSQALIPWLYNAALNQYRIYAMLQAEDELGYDARENIEKIERTEDEEYLRRGLNIVKRIGTLLNGSGDLEAEAMALIYEADFQRLLDLGTAFAVYREAIAKLQDTGVSESVVAEFFATPTVLPADRFYQSLDEAMLNRQQTTHSIAIDHLAPMEFSYNLGEFVAWNKSLLFSRRPRLPDMAHGLESDYYHVDLRLTVNSRGEARSPRIINTETNNAPGGRKVRDAVKKMRFRPLIVGDRHQSASDIFMRVSYPIPP